MNSVAMIIVSTQRFIPFPKEILESSKLIKFADDNFRFDENGRKYFKRLENTMGKGEIARFEQFLIFPQCFPDLYCRQIKGLFGKGLTCPLVLND